MYHKSRMERDRESYNRRNDIQKESGQEDTIVSANGLSRASESLLIKMNKPLF